MQFLLPFSRGHMGRKWKGEKKDLTDSPQRGTRWASPPFPLHPLNLHSHETNFVGSKKKGEGESSRRRPSEEEEEEEDGGGAE